MHIAYLQHNFRNNKGFSATVVITIQYIPQGTPSAVVYTVSEADKNLHMKMSHFNLRRPGDKMMYQLMSVIIQLSSCLTHIRRRTTLHTNVNLLPWMLWNPCYLGFDEIHVLRYPWRLLISFCYNECFVFSMLCVYSVYIFCSSPYSMGFCDALLFQSNPLWIWITQIMITPRGQLNAMILMISSELLSMTRIMK